MRLTRCPLSYSLILFLFVMSHAGIVFAETAKQLYDIAIVAGQQGRCHEALQLLRRANSLDQKNMPITMSLVTAIDCTEERLSNYAAKTLFQSTRVGNIGNWNASLTLAQNACVSAPQYSPAYIHLGTVHAKMAAEGNEEHVNNAISAFKKAIEIDPKSGLAHFNLGLAYASQHQWQLAKQQLSNASSLNYEIPRDLVAHVEDGIRYKSNKSQNKKDEHISKFWPFGPYGFICQYAYTNASSDFEKNVLNVVSGGCELE